MDINPGTAWTILVVSIIAIAWLTIANWRDRKNMTDDTQPPRRLWRGIASVFVLSACLTGAALTINAEHLTIISAIPIQWIALVATVTGFAALGLLSLKFIWAIDS
jgi:hypothetical protein